MKPTIIIIANSESLDTFARKFANQSKMKPTQVKTIIAKSEGFDHISALEKSFDANLLQSDSYKHLSEVNQIKTIDYGLEQNDQFIQTLLDKAEVDEVDDLEMDHWEQAEQTVAEAADELQGSKELEQALALLNKHGLHDAANTMAAVALASREFNFIKENV